MKEEISNGDACTGGEQPANSWRSRWIKQIRFTWILALIASVVPAVIYGTAFTAAIVVMATVILGIPTGLAAFLVKDKEWRSRIWRRLVVLLVTAISTYAVISETDKLTPLRAAPIAQAVEVYKRDTMKYPDSLADLNPNYLEELPAVRLAILQPMITYTIRDGKPLLRIPAAIGDQFSNYEYDFDKRAWAKN
ncbi:hypothetical protein LF844_17075 [Metapseudomonas lalkuanensis]|uniref:hypothetical protein n=1 Tax=Metapseudomonas lalkuanensis TaxID=2604832 RepID=UPI001CF55E21|nr:hypothetical protein [Pseudomonas lalkuanensis]UCO96386.1 hypothetical protein LF844_17075 [Pseudomonas lalkuanensis]